MKNILKNTALSMALALSLCAPAVVMAKAKVMKHSAEHMTAVKKCNDDYKAAIKDAKARKGKERKAAEAAARAAKKQCMASAPK
ncbi:MAG: hypothetical protein LC754_11735 [Acidobacteria bacterium]|nr:hypothetical protein [Acidobacteriota bacterium]